MPPPRLELRPLWLEPGAFQEKPKCWCSKVTLHKKRNNLPSLTNKKTDLIFTDALSIKVAFQQVVKDNDNRTFLVAFALPKKTLLSFDAIN